MFNRFRRKKKKSIITADNCSPELIAHIADTFTEMCKQQTGNDEKLDFTVESLSVVDDFIDTMSAYAKISSKAMENTRAMAGCYILEVGRRNYGGVYKWFDQLEIPVLVSGMPDNSISIDALSKVEKRIRNGVEDNISFFFQGYAELMEKAKTEKGISAMII